MRKRDRERLRVADWVQAPAEGEGGENYQFTTIYNTEVYNTRAVFPPRDQQCRFRYTDIELLLYTTRPPP